MDVFQKRHHELLVCSLWCLCS